MDTTFGSSSIPTALYFGSQTAMFEVLGAYLFALYFRRHIRQSSAQAYGLSLAFWENGVLLGILPLVSLLADFIVIASGPPSLASQVSIALRNASPGLFVGTIQAMPSLGYSILERVSSLLLHFSWGFLVVSAVTCRRRLYLWFALPMGFVDSIVPFAGVLGLPLTEALFFAIGLMALFTAIEVKRKISKNEKGELMEKAEGPRE